MGMKKILTLTAIALGLSGGVALADRDHGRGGRSEVRDHRGDRVVVRDRGRVDTRVRVDNRRTYNNNRVRVVRERPAFRNNRFYFSGGTYRQYHRPVINVRYRDYYRRPALVVENYDPMPGYIWMAGQWSWNGYEWIWMNGHYEVDQSYQEDYSPGFRASATFGY